MTYTYTIPLPPITKKNSQQILTNHRTGRPFIAPSKPYKQYEEKAIHYLARKTKATLQAPCRVVTLFYMPTRRRICPKCNRELRNKKKGRPKGTAHTVGETAGKQEQANPPLKRRVKPIPQCVREADALGISYGQYVQRGYDKVVSTIKQKERNRKNGRS